MAAGGVPTPFMGSGVKQDLHLLCSKFVSIESNRIRDFADIFRESRFETILHYRLSPSEYMEFAEYLLHNAALYFGKENEIGVPRPFKERIFGIFVCYALYNLQPVDHICQIPVTLIQFEDLLNFQENLVANKEVEALAALKNLLIKKAFQLKMFQSTYDPTTHKKYLAEEDMPNYSRKPIEPFARVRNVKNDHALAELSYIHNIYIQAKKKVGATDIKIVNKKKPSEEVEEILEKYETELGIIRAQSQETVSLPCAQEETTGSSRSTLKNKAYSADLKYTRQRRHLDPNMEENFKHLNRPVTFGQIAQECLAEGDNQEASHDKRLKRSKRLRKIMTVNTEEELDDNAIAEEVLRKEYASRLKSEIVEPEPVLCGKVSKQGTSGIAKIRAPKRANVKLVQEKLEREKKDIEPITVSDIDASFKSPTRKSRKTASQKVAKPRITGEWANKLHAWHGQVEATDSQVKKLTNLIKLEEIDDDE